MKTAVFYYTQSGQALDVAKRMCKPLEDEAAASGMGGVIYKSIVPLEAYPFPWSKREFFDTFPETRLGLPPSGIEPIDLSDIEDADVVIIVGQSWFLSPSLPIQSFFADRQVKEYLHGRNVIFVNVCRNMWLMTHRRVKEYLHDAQAKYVGHIVLQDKVPNLVSIITIVRWLMYGKKEASGIFPRAGVSVADVQAASRFGSVIRECKDDFDQLQPQLLAEGAIDYKPSILLLEKAGHRMFGLWAKFIRRKGGFRDSRRAFRCEMFFWYLLFVLYVVSPFAQLFFYLTYPLQHVCRNKQQDCYLNNETH